MTPPVWKAGGGVNSLVRCPKCGYVSFPGLPKCKKCGLLFPPSPGETLLRPAGIAKSAAPEGPIPEPLRDSKAPIEVNTGLAASEPPSQTNDWQDELSKRVEGFRQRRARLHGKDEGDGNLELDFDALEVPREARERESIDFPVNAPPPPPVNDDDLHEKTTLEFRPPSLANIRLDNEAPPIEHGRPAPRRGDDAGQAPILVESSAKSEYNGMVREASGSARPTAGVGERFLAGMLDVLVLLGGAGLFALIFWRAGGRVSHQPLDLAVIGFVLCVFILLYFGVMTALTSSTPGLIWVGLEIRAQNGQEPGVREAAWRAVGCLISAGALMLGFLWAVVDADGMTWHDRMSGTFIARSEFRHDAPQTGVLQI